MGGEKELLESGRPLAPRRIRLGALVSAGLVISTLIVVREWPRPAPADRPVAVPSTSPRLVPPPAPAPTSTLHPWPTAPEACGGNADLPIVSSAPVQQRTGIRVLVGGARLSSVDFDTGRAVPRMRLRPGEFVVGLLAASRTYALTGMCSAPGTTSGSRLVRIGTDGSATAVLPAGSIDTVIADGPHAWGVRFPDDRHPNGYLVRLEGGSRVRLPAGFWPYGITGGVVVGFRSSAPERGLLVDMRTGHVRANLRADLTLAVGHGAVLWTDGCDPSSTGPCTVHRRSVSGGATASYALPRSRGFTTGVISADGRLLAFTLERATGDPRYDQGHPVPPADIAVLHLDTGALDVVPGIEVPPKTARGLAFSADGRWLVMALNAGTKTRLLAWRQGLPRPYESKAVAGLVLGPPAILVLPPADR